ncbi:MAG TPA: carboxymuconolactone decarboxylase family protein [Stellaceae bacterium]|nr:carboxymuconolactone decarboxylase family protein [Stellaceae bacterium]
MAEPRFRTPTADEMDEAQRRVAAALVASPRGALRGPYIPLIRSPELADRMRHLGDFIRFEGVLPARLKEIVILLAARHWSVDYMFAVHREMSAATGLARAAVAAIAAGRRPAGLDPAEAAAHDMVRELLRAGRVGDAAFAAARDALGERGVVELTAFVGYYTALAMILNVAQIAPPAGAAPLPPLGADPV